MVDTRNPSFHLEAFRRFADHSTKNKWTMLSPYWDALQKIKPPYDLSPDKDMPDGYNPYTDLMFKTDHEKQEQLAFNNEYYWYLDPISLEPKKEITELIGIGKFKDDLLKKYYYRENETDFFRDNLILKDMWYWKPQTSFKFRQWTDPVYSEDFMTFQPFNGKDLIAYLKLVKEKKNVIYHSLEIGIRDGYKPSLEDIEKITSDGYHWREREYNRFFWPILRSDSDELLFKEK
jgi:hypothetical protein